MHAGLGNEWCRQRPGYRHAYGWAWWITDAAHIHVRLLAHGISHVCTRTKDTTHRAGTHGHTWVRVERTQEWNKGILYQKGSWGISHHPALHRVKYCPLFSLIAVPLLAYLFAVSGWVPWKIARSPLIRLSWHLFLIYFPCGDLFNTHSCLCVCLSIWQMRLENQKV